MLLLLDPCPLFHTRPIEWRHSRTGPDPALRRTWRPHFTHEGAVTPGALAPVRNKKVVNFRSLGVPTARPEGEKGESALGGSVMTIFDLLGASPT